MTLWGALRALILVLTLVVSALAQGNQTEPGGQSVEAEKQPLLVVDERIHDFGNVTPGKALRWVFKIRNVGNADLLIHSVAPG